jgi:hypothetical protein
MQGLNDFLSRIQTDHEFYFLFRKSPQEALAAYELSSEERAGLTESGAQLRPFGWSAEPPGSATRAGIADSRAAFWWTIHTETWRMNFDYSMPADSKFNSEAALARPEVRRTVAEIHNASTDSDRLAAVLGLMEYIG